jgi:hypothetical protein
MSRRHARIAAVLLLVALAETTPPTAQATLSLTTTAAPTFSDNLDLGDQTQSYTVPLTASITGTSNVSGWNLTITSTQLATGGGAPHTLSTTASTVTSVTSACPGGGCINPTSSVGYPVALPAGMTPPPAVKFFVASLGTGKGTFTITPTINVNVPQNTYSGTYTSALTLAITSGP